MLAARSGITLRYTDRDEGEGRKRQQRLFELTERAATGTTSGCAPARRRRRPVVPAQPRLRRGRGRPVPHRLGARRVGRHGPGVEGRRGRPRGERPRLHRTRPAVCRTSSGRASSSRSSTSVSRVVGFGGRKLPDSEGAEVPELPRQRALQQVQGALRAELGQGRRGEPRRGRRVRGLHRRHRVRPGRGATCRRDVRHGAHRGARAAAQALLAVDSCWPTTPTRRARRQPTGSTPGSRRTTSRCRSSRCPTAPIPTSSPAARPTPCAPRWPRHVRSSRSGSTGCSAGRPAATSKAAPVPRRPRSSVVAEHPDALVRDQYVMQVADICRIDADRLRERLEQVRRQPAPAAATTRTRRSSEREQSRGWGDDEPLPEERPGEEDHGTPRRSSAPVPELRNGVETEALRLVLNDRSRSRRPTWTSTLFTHPTAAHRLPDRSRRRRPSAEAIDEAPGPVARAAHAPRGRDQRGDHERRAVPYSRPRSGARCSPISRPRRRASEDPLAYAASVAWLKVTLDELRTFKSRGGNADPVASLAPGSATSY